MLKVSFYELWAYLKVILLSGILFFIIAAFFDINIIAAFLIKSAKHWIKLFSVFLAASFGFYWNYFKQNDSNFGEWLHWKGASQTYSRGFVFPIIVYIIDFILLIILCEMPSIILAKITFGFMIYGIITLIALLVTICDFIKLSNLFRAIHRAESIKDKL